MNRSHDKYGCDSYYDHRDACGFEICSCSAAEYVTENRQQISADKYSSSFSY